MQYTTRGESGPTQYYKPIPLTLPPFHIRTLAISPPPLHVLAFIFLFSALGFRTGRSTLTRILYFTKIDVWQSPKPPCTSTPDERQPERVMDQSQQRTSVTNPCVHLWSHLTDPPVECLVRIQASRSKTEPALRKSLYLFFFFVFFFFFFFFLASSHPDSINPCVCVAIGTFLFTEGLYSERVH